MVVSFVEMTFVCRMRRRAELSSCKDHPSFSSLRGSWSLLTAKLDSDYSRVVMVYLFFLPLREDATLIQVLSTFVALDMTVF